MMVLSFDCLYNNNKKHKRYKFYVPCSSMLSFTALFCVFVHGIQNIRNNIGDNIGSTQENIQNNIV